MKNFFILASDITVWDDSEIEDNWNLKLSSSKMKCDAHKILTEYSKMIYKLFIGVKNQFFMDKENFNYFYLTDPAGDCLHSVFVNEENYKYKGKKAFTSKSVGEALNNLESFNVEKDEFYRIYSCLAWQITELSIDRDIEDSIDDVLWKLDEEDGDRKYFINALKEISLETSEGLELYMSSNDEYYKYLAFEETGEVIEESDNIIQDESILKKLLN